MFLECKKSKEGSDILCPRVFPARPSRNIAMFTSFLPFFKFGIRSWSLNMLYFELSRTFFIISPNRNTYTQSWIWLYFLFPVVNDITSNHIIFPSAASPPQTSVWWQDHGGCDKVSLIEKVTIIKYTIKRLDINLGLSECVIITLLLPHFSQ